MHVVNSPIKLPTISLPDFSGHYKEWIEFYDVFQSLIHSNNEISVIQKFNYLKSALRGDAANLILGLEISTTNYEIAWHLLKERFHNNRLIIQRHVKALFDFSPHRDNLVSLREIYDSTKKHLRSREENQQNIGILC